MFCANCGDEIGEVNFCSSCGAKREVSLPPTPDLELVASGGTLSVQVLYADLKVCFHNEPGVKVLVSGHEKAKAGIRLLDTPNGAYLHEDIPGVQVFRNSNNLRTNGDQCWINDCYLDPKYKLQVTVFLPKTSSLQLGDLAVCPVAKVEDADDFTISCSGSSSLSTGSYRKLKAQLSGSCDLSFATISEKLRVRISGSGAVYGESVSGQLDLGISGAGKAKIAGGEVESAEVDISGAGKATLNLTAIDADLGVSGVGNIFLRHCVNRPTKSISGMGSISVGNW